MVDIAGEKIAYPHCIFAAGFPRAERVACKSSYENKATQDVSSALSKRGLKEHLLNNVASASSIIQWCQPEEVLIEADMSRNIADRDLEPQMATVANTQLGRDG